MLNKLKNSLVILTVLLSTTTLSNTAQAGSKECMAKAIYFESRGGSKKDMMSVGHTVMNRVKSKAFPNNVCSVVKQKHQFAPHITNGTSIKDKTSWSKSINYSKNIISGKSKDFTNGATYFHTPAINPKWAGKFKKVYRNNQHIFYKP